MTRFSFFAGVLLLLAGCVGIPQRELENSFQYRSQKPSAVEEREPIDSRYQELASKAWKNMEEGGRAEYVSILETGDDALLARIHLIRAARHTIDLQTFIWKDDSTTRFVFDELVKAAERGVSVRMLIDGLNMPGSPEYLARMARSHRNIEICLYKPLSEYAEQSRFGLWDNMVFKAKRMNRRMHNKLLLVDGRIGIAGGRNYEGKYYDRDPDFLFHDRDVLVAGPAVMDMQDSFEIFWQDKEAVFLTQLVDVRKAFEQLPKDSRPFSRPQDARTFREIDRLASTWDLSQVRKGLKIYEADRVRFVYDTPKKFDGEKHTQFIEWVDRILVDAQKRLVYQTPYLIYDKKTRKAFVQIKKKHPQFRIVASSNSLAAADHASAYAISFKHRKQLYKKSGIDIYEAKPHPADAERYVPGYDELAARALEREGKKPPKDPQALRQAGPVLCIHAKSFVVDRRIAMIGSHNFDPRSLKLNTECGLFIDDPEVAGILEDRIFNACEPGNAWTVSKAPSTPVISHFSGFIGAVSTALPFLDIWPYRYTTDYELKEGAAPLLPRDPAFQENYIDVGYFPGVPDSGKVTRAKLMKAFGGWARPMM